MEITRSDLSTALDAALPIRVGHLELALAPGGEAVTEAEAGGLQAELQLTYFEADGALQQQFSQPVLLVTAGDRGAPQRLSAYITGWARALAQALAAHPHFEAWPRDLALPELLHDASLLTPEAVCAAALDEGRLGGIGTPAWSNRLWRRDMEELGLGAHAAALRSYLASSVRLTLYAPEEPLPVGRSRVGGEPDLPPDFEWPYFHGLPMTFIAQFNLSEVAPYDREARLPRSGMLYLFYDARQEAAGFDPRDRGAGRVFHWEGDPAALTRTPPPEELPDSAQLPPCEIEFSTEQTVPPVDSPHYEALVGPLTPEHARPVSQFISEYGAQPEPDEPIHRLLGHPEPVQGDLYTECQLAANGVYCGDPSGFDDPRYETLRPGALDWQLLLQLDSDDADDWMWGDAGRLYFMIRREDLAARRFDAVWVVLQGH